MLYLVAGLVVFLGAHSVRIFAEGWRSRTVAKLGEKPYKGMLSLVSLFGFVLLVWGFGVARETPIMLWNPPVAMRHIAALLTLIAFVFLAAANGLPNAIKARVGHPMVVAVKTWALAHLMANGSLAHLILFGSFLVWAVLAFIAARKRDRAQNVQPVVATTRGTVMAVVVGAVTWALFAFWLHGLLIGVKPFG
jgi:uncharacterized membrane protein